MGKVNVKMQMRLLKEANKYLKDIKDLEGATGAVVLTQEHIIEWIETFNDDLIKLEGCNYDTVKR